MAATDLARSFLAATLIVGAALSAGCPNEARNEGIKRSNAGYKALGSKQYDTAVTEFKESVASDKSNHQAWYGLGNAYLQKKTYEPGIEALENAVRLKPSDAMYQLRLGQALYEGAVDKARDLEATRTKKKKDDVEIDLRSLNFDSALQHLEAAAKANPELYAAHFYIGRIYRAQDKPQQAAEAFTRSIVAWPRFSAPYVALGEMYRRWDYPDQAIQVVSQGVEHVMEQEEKSQLLFVLGMAYFDKLDDSKAIESFSKAIEIRKDNHDAKFQRGLAYFRKGELKAADKDLEEYAKAAGPSAAANKSIAQKIRFQIAAKQGG